MNDTMATQESAQDEKLEANDAVEVAAIRSSSLADLVCLVAESGGSYARPQEKEKARQIIARMIRGEVEQAVREGILKGLDLAARFK